MGVVLIHDLAGPHCFVIRQIRNSSNSYSHELALKDFHKVLQSNKYFIEINRVKINEIQIEERGYDFKMYNFK
jgi:hypothetical protein